MNVPKTSSYTRYLPPLFWSKETDPDEFLARWLCIFEKMLTGRDDGVTLRRPGDASGRTDPSIDELIDRLPDLFQPWKVPARFLPFVAQTLGLPLAPHWDEAMQRRTIERATALYQRRWLRSGLHTYLEVYATAAERPRVAVDDGEALLKGYLSRDAGFDFLDLFPIAYARPGGGKTRPQVSPALTHPVAVAVGTDKDGRREYLVADAGLKTLAAANRQAKLWRLLPRGDFRDWAGSPAQPAPFNTEAVSAVVPPLRDPCAVAAEGPGVYLVLDRVQEGQPDVAVIYRYREVAPRREVAVAAAVLKAAWPVDMARAPDGRLFVLDKGRFVGGAFQTRLLVVTFAPGAAPTVQSVPLHPEVQQPTCLALTPGGDLLVADAREQETDQAAPYPDAVKLKLAGNVVRVTLGPPVVLRPLLRPAAADRSLIFPKGILAWSETLCLVLDEGLKTGVPQNPPMESARVMAEPTRAFWLVDDGTAAQLRPAALNYAPMDPRGLVRDGNAVLVLEHGAFQFAGAAQQQEWRTQPHTFGVAVDFSGERPVSPEALYRFQLMLQRLFDRERPGHLQWLLKAPPRTTNVPPGPGGPGGGPQDEAPDGERPADEEGNHERA